MRYFMTGATGFIGRHLCKKLVADGHHVTALVRTPEKASVLPKTVDVLAGDLGVFKSLDLVLPECDVVVHLAGVVTADTEAQYYAINYTAVEDFLGALSRQSWQPKRFLFASSLAAAGPSVLGQAWTEQDALAPIDPYGKAKAQAETLLTNAPFPTTAFRPPMVFGPEDAATLTLFRAAQFGVGVRVAGEPQRLSFVDVRDAVDGIARMAEDTRPEHYTYYLSHPDATNTTQLWRGLGVALHKRVWVIPLPRFVLYSAMQIATWSAKVLPFKNQLDEKQYQQMAAPAFQCSSAALCRDLGWQPTFALQPMLNNAVEGYKAVGMLK